MSAAPAGRLSALLLLLWAALLTGCQAEQSRPNILLIVLDDFGYNDLASNNGADSPTPTLDEIAARGIRYTRHYAESSCTPSRVALLTGMYPARVGAHPFLSGIDHELVTLPDSLAAAGYRNYMIGKWHAGDSHREARPEFQGFQRWFGFVNQLYLQAPGEAGPYRRARPTYLNPWLEDEQGTRRQYRGHLTDILTDRALAVMRSEQDPWFIYLSYYAPHSPVEPAQSYASRFPDDDAGRYQALKMQLDTNIGRVLAYLEESGALDNTMLVVVSDNGGTARHWPSNLPFPGFKATYTEGGVRTPLLLLWPERWPQAEQRELPVMITDIYPTIMAALGLEAPAALDGVDLFARPRPRLLRWYAHGLLGDRFSVLSEDGQWRFSALGDGTEQLNAMEDLGSGQSRNRLAQHPDIASSLRSDMQSWIPELTRVSQLRPARRGPWTIYRGEAFRRTPLNGTHSMGLVFRRGEDREMGQRQRLVQQKAYIDISEADGELRLRMDGQELELELPEGESCFTLFVTSALVKSNMIFFKKKSVSRIQVYLNGELAAGLEYQNPVINEASPSAPLKIAGLRSARWYMPPEVQPYLSTRWLQAAEIRELAEGSCELPVAQQGLQIK